MALWALSVGWGTVGVATRAALENGVGSLTIVTGRLVIAAGVVAAAQLFLRRRMTWDAILVRTGTVMAVVGVAMPFVLFNNAYQHASAGFVGLMAALAPLGTAIFAHLLIPGETLGRRRLVGLSLAIAGVAVLLFSGDSGLAVGGRPSMAIAWSIPGVAAFSFSTVYAKRQTASLAGFDVLVVQFAVAIVLMLAPTFVLAGQPRLEAESWWLLVYLAIGLHRPPADAVLLGTRAEHRSPDCVGRLHRPTRRDHRRGGAHEREGRNRTHPGRRRDHHRSGRRGQKRT